jgi:hypothetical protein
MLQVGATGIEEEEECGEIAHIVVIWVVTPCFFLFSFVSYFMTLSLSRY